jgi:hypothetical protein
MLSLTSRMNRWSGGGRVRRALALPLAAAFVGFSLTTTSAQLRRPSASHGLPDNGSLVEAAPTLECSFPLVHGPNGRLHSPVALLDAPRRTTPAPTDALPATAISAVCELEATVATTSRYVARRSAEVARGYDATAPPIRHS